MNQGSTFGGDDLKENMVLIKEGDEQQQ